MSLPIPNASPTDWRGSRPGKPTRRGVASLVLVVLAIIPIVYSLGVLIVVAGVGDLGLSCVLGTEVKQAVPASYEWTPDRPQRGDQILSIGGHTIANYPDFVASLRETRRQLGREVEVTWREANNGPVHHAQARVARRPWGASVWSSLWFLQEMAIFALGVLVLWKRPADESARLFFWLCVATVGAYIGGYHWTEIVVEPLLIYPFALFAMALPVASLHFYLIFPRVNPTFATHRPRILMALYGLPALWLGGIWSQMRRIGALRDLPSGPAANAVVVDAVWWIKWLALSYIAVSVVVFILCIVCLRASYRAAQTKAERNQAYWILLATWLSVPSIGYMLASIARDPARLGLSSAAWPMYVVSLLYTVAYALSITRYQLVKAESLYNRSRLYVLVSISAGLLYSALLVGTTLVIGDRLLADQTSRGAVVAGVVVIAMLILTGAIRERFQRVIDRRFSREKYKFDEAMQRMNLAVGRLVDRGALGRRLLEAAAETLRLEWGAIFLADEPAEPLHLAAWHGPPPDERTLALDNPLVIRLGAEGTVRSPHLEAVPRDHDPATDAMIALGGEIARALVADGRMVGLLVLGPKRNGLPYEDEEVAFLGALSSVAMLALHSAGIQQTLERLNAELRDKVDKIAEQQRRILILQDQLTDRTQPSEPAGEPRGAVLDPPAFGRIRGSGPAVRGMLAVARKVAASSSAVLIRGESGTGKELMAEAIHAAGPRATGPFVRVHCAALAQNLLESELFGHVRGAFTGADRDRVGRFEQAHGGTLFLDEIGDINLEVQTKLLRVLQERAFERVGSSQTISVDVRIVAATHQDLEALIRAGRFREDLFYRLNVIPVRTPPLRERREDIFELAVHFLGQRAERIGRVVSHIDDDAIEALMRYGWPGNVRELENVIERAVVLADGPALTRRDLPLAIREPAGSGQRPLAPPVRAGTLALPERLSPDPAAAAAAARRTTVAVAESVGPDRGDLPARRAGRPVGGVSGARRDPVGGSPGEGPIDPEFAAFERLRLRDALDSALGNKAEAARLLGLPRSTFLSKLKKHGIATRP